MVRRKTTKKPMAKKRVYRRRRVYKKRPMFTPYSNLPLGQGQIVKHRYLENFQIGTTLGTPGTYTFQLNSLYDPNVTGGGHQPLGNDQMEALFKRYCVLGARVNFKCWNRDSDEYLAFGIYFSENLLGVVDLQALLEQGSIKYVILPPAGINPRVQQMNANISIKKFAKIRDTVDYTTLGADVGGSPARAIYMHVIVWQPDGGSTSAAGSFYMTLDQVALWSKPQQVAKS